MSPTQRYQEIIFKIATPGRYFCACRSLSVLTRLLVSPKLYSTINRGSDASTNTNTPNDDFSVINTGSGNVAIEDTGPNAWSGKCVGDAYNSATDYYTSLDPCPGGSNGNGGWSCY